MKRGGRRTPRPDALDYRLQKARRSERETTKVVPPSPRDPMDWDVAFWLHEQEGWTYARIAREHGYAYHTVRDALRKRGARAPRPVARGLMAIKIREVWRFMHEKCEKPDHSSYRYHGARGARVGPEWTDFDPFYRWARETGYRVGLRLLLVDERRPYGPGNCRWVTAQERVRTRKPRERRSPVRKKPEPIDWEKASRLYLEEELSQPEVARRVGASYTGIVIGFKRLGITRPKEAGPTSTPEGRRLHKTWMSLRARCSDPNNPLYPYNGALGARVCDEWKTFGPFLDWARRSGARPHLWLTRIDREKGYAPKNCEWMTPQEAARKKRPPTKQHAPRRLITTFGETKGIMQWSRDRRCSVSATTISNRIASGWAVKTAITEPAENRGGSDNYFTELLAFGEKKGITDWTRDRRCKVGLTGLVDRLGRGWSPEDALTTLPYKEPASPRPRARKAQANGPAVTERRGRP